MTFGFKVLSLLLITRFAGGSSLGETPVGDLENLKIEEELKTSNNVKRSPLEVGFVSFELDHRHGRHFNVPSLVRPNVIPKTIPIVSKSRTISTTSTISNGKGPKGDHILVPLGNDHVIIPVLKKVHPIEPNIILDHKELLVDHTAKLVIDQKHETLVLEHEPLVLTHPNHQTLVINHPNSHTVIFQHKPVLVDHREHETNVLIHSMPKTLIVEHKPAVVVTHPVHKNIVIRPGTAVIGTSRTILLSPKSQIHEIIVHRHVPKAVVVHQAVDEERNMFRSHVGGFGVGLNYGGHGAGHGFHVPVF